MSNPSSLNLHEVIRDVVEEILQERANEVESEMAREGNQEKALEVMPEEIEVVVEEKEDKAFYSHKGAEVFQKYLAKKIFVEERGFKELVLPFKEEIE